MTEGTGTPQNRPAAMVAWGQEQEERQKYLMEQYPDGEPEPVGIEFGTAMQRSFTEAWSELSPAGRAAEIEYLNSRLREDPAHAYLDVNLRSQLIRGVSFNEVVSRNSVEQAGITAAQGALGHSRYLGGFPDYPTPADTSAFFCAVDQEGGLKWVSRSDDEVAHVTWPELVEMRVGATDRGQERVTAPRVVAFGLFALGAKKQRREAMLAVKTAKGEGIFIVYGLTPLELQAALAPLVSRIGQATSDQFMADASDTCLDAKLLEEAHQQFKAWLAR